MDLSNEPIKNGTEVSVTSTNSYGKYAIAKQNLMTDLSSNISEKLEGLEDTTSSLTDSVELLRQQQESDNKSVQEKINTIDKSHTKYEKEIVSYLIDHSKSLIDHSKSINELENETDHLWKESYWIVEQIATTEEDLRYTLNELHKLEKTVFIKAIIEWIILLILCIYPFIAMHKIYNNDKLNNLNHIPTFESTVETEDKQIGDSKIHYLYVIDSDGNKKVVYKYKIKEGESDGK